MSGNVGDTGYYIVDNRRANKDIYYGPFRNKEFAQFFNFIAFGSPREVSAQEEAEVGIVLCKETPENAEHPRIMFASNSRFSLWIHDTYGKPLTTKLVLDMAKESGAKGYKSFTNWIINGSKINGSHLASRES
jgi:hypothetical protein